ncbi:enoyl-CoA hydratase (plasmid) [Sphingobium sp. SJ10-10]|uniref:Enoyl-CoA hydratase n=1 Tax=Sphingomonas sp. NS2 TaxID=908605 RepID=A0A0D4ZZI9_9SPHN|nr:MULTISPECIES: enoyl-CoA hydratase [unclassified Sphingobium]AJW29368.1 Enoyl-CoA hydratase [Sphingomonas sp. NS2]AMK26570.1 enoyl-CoA hydratase [Sphingobium sp. TKS]MEC6699590.1 enoyl-CoA hydratase [Sphingobium sp. SJ10-10]NML91720.1 enoyl-CoA hydratase [Sphingobium sp. TB-6]
MTSEVGREAFETIVFEDVVPGVVRIALNRPESRNAQNAAMLYELNTAFNQAARDDSVKVIILAARGKHFSSGHDLRIPDFVAEMAPWDPVGTWCGFSCTGAEGRMGIEKEMFLGLSERWRNIPKVTIAQVQGKAISGGLMLIWPCDIIIAAEDAEFADNTADIGVAGAEFFNHPWELGVRKAKEMLFTSDFIDAQEAYRLGMVNHVVPREELQSFTEAMACKIAKKPAFTLKLLKEAVNAAQDAQGRVNAMGTSFALHQLSHSHNEQIFGLPIDPTNLPAAVRDKAAWKGKPASE